MRSVTHRIRLALSRASVICFGYMVIAVSLALSLPTTARAAPVGPKPTVVFVHGAFAESSSWDGVIGPLLAKGYATVAVANPLRGLRSDAAYVSDILDSIAGPVVLVGHSYGGNVITNAAFDKANVKALVYVAAFAPDMGESAGDLAGKFPGATLSAALAPPVTLWDGSKDLYLQQARYHAQFAADLPKWQADLLGATQRPIAERAILEASGMPAWKTIPSWFIYGTSDLNIPATLQAFMATRANAKRVVVVQKASHVVMVSNPDLVVKLILEAAGADD